MGTSGFEVKQKDYNSGGVYYQLFVLGDYNHSAEEENKKNPEKPYTIIKPKEEKTYHIGDVTIKAPATFTETTRLPKTPIYFSGFIVNDTTGAGGDAKFGNVVNVEGSTYINLEGNKTAACVNPLTVYGVYNQKNTVNFNEKDVFIRAVPHELSMGDGVAIVTKADGQKTTTSINADGGNTVKIIGDVDNRRGDTTTFINLTNKNSYWYGGVNQSLRNVSGIHLGLSSGARWIPTKYTVNSYVNEQDAKIGTVNLSNGGIIDLSKDNFASAETDQAYVEGMVGDGQRTNSTNHSLTINQLNGQNGIVKMDLYYDKTKEKVQNKGDEWYKGAASDAKNTSDYLNITTAGDKTAQTIAFNFADSHLSDMQIGSKLYFASVGQGTVDFSAATEQGALDYISAANVYDYTYGIGSDAGADKGIDYYIGLTGKRPGENVDIAKNSMAVSYLLGSEMDRLNKRMGEERYIDGEKGLWVRYRHARTEWDDAFTSSGNMFQLGYDTKKKASDADRYQGIALDYAHNDVSFTGLGGDGEVDRYGVVLYDTWMGNKGHYRDITIRGGRLSSDYDLKNPMGEALSSDYHQWFAAAGIEWGRRLDREDGWYFEPQTQFQIGRIGGADYTTGAGVSVSQDAVNTAVARAGFRIGRSQYKGDAEKERNFYFKADVLHEFLGDRDYALTGADGRFSESINGSDTWYDIGIGADITLNEGRWLWIDLERILGSDYGTTWQVNGGLRWAF